jgi:hypothetical protein
MKGNKMAKPTDSIKWVYKIGERLSEEYHLTFQVKVDKHIKIIFWNDSGQSCLLCLAKSSSDKNVRHIEIGLIRRELRKKLNLETRRDCFTLSYSPCLS